MNSSSVKSVKSVKSVDKPDMNSSSVKSVDKSEINPLVRTHQAGRKPRRATSTNTQRLFEHLHRGGDYAHLWTDAGHQSYWFAVGNDADRTARRVPRHWLRHNVYFTVHPLSQIPPQNTAGNRDPRYISSQLAYITAVNALFAEYDGKDYVQPSEYRPHLPHDFATMKRVDQRNAIQTAKEQVFYTDPAPHKACARAVIDALYFPPSVIVDSGGGYHCYWLLHETLPIDEANRPDVQAVQHHWVQMVQADPGAADLRRLLRLPGTFNRKPGFGNHPPRVDFCKADFTLRYHYTDLEEAVNDWLFIHRPKQVTGEPRWRTPRSQSNDLRAAFNGQHSLVDLLIQHGYQVSFRGPIGRNALTRLARPGRDKHHSSVTVFAAREDGTPELAIHFSSNDPLYSEPYADPATGQTKRHARDAFATYVLLEHDGDWQAAHRLVQP
jgi:hypothetical protein